SGPPATRDRPPLHDALPICAEGRPALGEPGAAANGAGTLLRGSRRLSRRGQAVHHHVGVSAFADLAVISRRSLITIDPDLPFDHAALFGCAVLTGVGRSEERRVGKECRCRWSPYA